MHTVVIALAVLGAVTLVFTAFVGAVVLWALMDSGGRWTVQCSDCSWGLQSKRWVPMWSRAVRVRWHRATCHRGRTS